MAITRRQLLQSGAYAAITPALPIAAGLSPISPAQAQSASDLVWHHALSLFGDVKYPADFKRFDYVNPDAPKGGSVRQVQTGTFDNFNIVISGLKGAIAEGVGQIYEQLDDQVARRTFDQLRVACGGDRIPR